MQGKGSAISIQHITKSFGSFKALDDVSLDIAPGEFFSLLGPSGCGKTTLLRIIAGFEEPDQGEVLFDGTSVLRLPPEKRPCNMVFQNYALFPHLSVRGNIAFPLKRKGLGKEEREERVDELIRFVELTGHDNKKPGQLSGGQKQRVAIARALACEPDVLLLDEPLSALDAKLRQSLLVELDEIHDKVGITFIYVTHDQGEALSVSDHMAIFNEGRLLQAGTPYEIYESPSTLFTASFIGEGNIFPCTALSSRWDEEDDEWIITVDVPALGRTLEVTDWGPVEDGRRLYFSIRPEKVRIVAGDVDLGPGCFHGIVDEPVYAGYQSKFYVKTDEGATIRVLKSHTTYLEEGPGIEWKDRVSVIWRPADGYLVKEEWHEET